MTAFSAIYANRWHYEYSNSHCPITSQRKETKKLSQIRRVDPFIHSISEVFTFNSLHLQKVLYFSPSSFTNIPSFPTLERKDRKAKKITKIQKNKKTKKGKKQQIILFVILPSQEPQLLVSCLADERSLPLRLYPRRLRDCYDVRTYCGYGTIPLTPSLTTPPPSDYLGEIRRYIHPTRPLFHPRTVGPLSYPIFLVQLSQVSQSRLKHR